MQKKVHDKPLDVIVDEIDADVRKIIAQRDIYRAALETILDDKLYDVNPEAFAYQAMKRVRAVAGFALSAGKRL